MGDTGRIQQGQRDPQGSRETGDSNDEDHRGVGEKEKDKEKNQPSLNKIRMVYTRSLAKGLGKQSREKKPEEG
jgi:hypothetical protein